MLDNPQKIEALQELEGDRAQLLVDFLPLVSMRSFLTFSPESDLAKRATAALCQLAEALRLYPQRYVLSDITFGSDLRAEGFCDVYRGHRAKQPLCVKVFKEVDVELVPKVRFPTSVGPFLML